MKYRVLTLMAFVVLVATGVFWWAGTPTDVQADNSAQFCQTYRTVSDVNTVNFRSCASDTCEVTSSATAEDELCVLSIAQQDPSWLVVRPDPFSATSAYVEASLVEPGLPDDRNVVVSSDGGETEFVVTSTDGGYCDGYAPRVEEAVVRASPSLESPALGTITPTDAICAEQWAGSFIYWVEVNGGFARGNALQYQYVEGLECDSYQVVTSSLNVHSCDSFTCGVTQTLPQGQVVCVGGDSGESLTWIGFDYSGRTGWVYEPLLEQLPEELVNDFGGDEEEEEVDVETDDEFVEPTPSPTIAPTTVPYVIADGNIALRADNARDAEVVVGLNSRTPLEVLGIDESDWYYVQTRSGIAGWVSPESVTLRGNRATLPRVRVSNTGGQQQITIDDVVFEPPVPEQQTTPAGEVAQAETPTLAPLPETATIAPPLPLEGSFAEATQPAGIGFQSSSGAVTVTPTPGACQPGQTANCNTPTPISTALFEAPVAELSGVLLAQDIPAPIFRFRDVVLNSPQGAASFTFRLADDWVADGQNVVILDLTYTESTEALTESGRDILLTSRLNVLLDGNLIGSILLTPVDAERGQQTVQIEMPNELLNRQKFHRLELAFSAQDHCEARFESSVLFDAEDSLLHLEYQEELPLLDLSLYPRPFYNIRPPTENESVMIVLPADAGAADLSNAAAVAGGLGFLTDYSLDILLRRADTITPQERDSNDLILIGRPDNHSMIRDLYQIGVLPTDYNGQTISFQDVQFDSSEGVVQLATNPASRRLAMMVVTGTTDVGVRKAAMALAGPPGLLIPGGPLVVVTDTQQIFKGDIATLNTTIFSLRNLGVEEDIVLRGLGQTRADVEFTIPAGTELSTDAYVDVIFNYSRLLENPNSSFSVLINEVPVESIVLDESNLDANDRVSDADDEGARRLRAPISPSLVDAGQTNSLTFIVNAVTQNFECETPDGDVVWFTISDRSEMNLPRDLADASSEDNYVGLFPAPFNQLPNLGDLWINLPDEPTDAELEQAIQLVSLIGSGLANAEGVTPIINVGSIPADANMENYNIIAIGRPDNSSLVRDLNVALDAEGVSILPQPLIYDGQTVTLEQRLDDISFRLLPGFPVGVLQKLPSPFSQNPARKLLIITGTNEQGQQNAIDVLLSQDFEQGNLEGDVVFAAGGEVSFVDSNTVVTDPEEIFQELAELPTQRAARNMTQTATAQGTEVPTTTPQPSETPEPDITLEPTQIVTIMPSPTATIVPIVLDTADSDLLATQNTQPIFVTILIVSVGVLVLGMIIFVVARFFMRNRGSSRR